VHRQTTANECHGCGVRQFGTCSLSLSVTQHLAGLSFSFPATRTGKIKHYTSISISILLVDFYIYKNSKDRGKNCRRERRGPGHCRRGSQKFGNVRVFWSLSSVPMNHVQKRLVATAARLPSIAPTAVPVFPPKESFKPSKDAFAQEPFNPESWASLQPVPSTALVAFAHRIGLASLFSSPDLIRQACTHSSFLPLFRQQYPTKPEPATNAQLATIGNSLMGLFATEYIHAKYPYLPTRVTKAAVTAHVGPLTCDSVAKEMGAAPLLRWHRTVRVSLEVCRVLFLPSLQPGTTTTPPLLHSDALASIPRSLTGLIYRERSLLAAREFVHSYFLSRQVDLRGMIKFYNPKKSLLEMVQKYQREPPKSR